MVIREIKEQEQAYFHFHTFKLAYNYQDGKSRKIMKAGKIPRPAGHWMEIYHLQKIIFDLILSLDLLETSSFLTNFRLDWVYLTNCQLPVTELVMGKRRKSILKGRTGQKARPCQVIYHLFVWETSEKLHNNFKWVWVTPNHLRLIWNHSEPSEVPQTNNWYICGELIFGRTVHHTGSKKVCNIADSNCGLISEGILSLVPLPKKKVAKSRTS